MDGIFGSTGVWFLIGAILVWFMQAGFAMVETGFTRAKNAGNIIMKNLLDFCLGTIVFVLLGAGLLMGEDALFGLVGIPNLGVFTDFANYDWSTFFFNLVFCATTATIVSGAMAERTKFLSYCIYSLVISAVVYPIEAHWVWGGGWLTQEILGVTYIDFAGSSLIHMVGGISSFIGALILGPRWGKYLDKDGKPTLERKKAVYVRAIPGITSPSVRSACSSCGSAGTASTARRQRMWRSLRRSSSSPPSPPRRRLSPQWSTPGSRTKSRTFP